MKLAHKDRNQVLFRVDYEGGVVEPAPVVRTHGAEFGQEFGLARNTESQAIPHLLKLPLNVVLGHQLNGLAAHKTNSVELTAVQHHLAEPVVILSRGAKTATAGEIGARPAVRVIRRIAELAFPDHLLLQNRLKSLVWIVGVRPCKPGYFLVRQKEGRILHSEGLEDAVAEKLVERHP